MVGADLAAPLPLFAAAHTPTTLPAYEATVQLPHGTVACVPSLLDRSEAILFSCSTAENQPLRACFAAHTCGFPYPFASGEKISQSLVLLLPEKTS